MQNAAWLIVRQLYPVSTIKVCTWTHMDMPYPYWSYISRLAPTYLQGRVKQTPKDIIQRRI